MAEIILSALLPVIIEKLASTAMKKLAARSKKIHLELKKCQMSLTQIKTLLNDASQKEITSELVKGWLIRLRHLAYDMDDVLDALATDAMHLDPPRKITTKVKKLIPSTFLPSSSSTKLHYRKLNDIIAKLQQLYDERNELGLTVKADGRLKSKNRQYQTSLLPPNVFGRQGEKEDLLKKLLDDEQPKMNQNNFSIVPIVGMGGIGKTTLARLLYNQPKVNQHFELKSWVCVSDEFDSFNISKVIFESVAEEDKKGKKFEDLNLLQEALRNQLSGRRILLVLDDVWSETIEDWDTLVPPFYEVAPGSKIIITTRKKQLLQQLGNDNPYHLNKLSPDDALSMFAHHALDESNFDSYPTLRTYGQGIVEKCDGLPLALKSLGTSLRTRSYEEDWKEVLNSKIWSLKDEGGTLPALRVSYQELSASLKQLFAYSSLFPKDYVFEKEDLILLWMAEGFLHKSTTCEPMEMERLGEIYFNELLSKSFFENVDDDKSLFVMHDLMNDLATYVAREFFVRLDIETNNKYERDNLIRCRHMSFVRETYMACKKFKEFETANSLRTFLAVPVVVRNSQENDFFLSNKILVDLLPQLPLLRTLCLSNLEIDEIPESVGDLRHLRYVNLSQTPITHLPDKVSNLYNLQTLIVFGCDKLKKLPDNFLKLKNLRHFDIRDTPLLKNMPLGIGELKSLQTLSKIVIGGENEFGISRLKNLKNLRQRLSIHGLHKLQNVNEARVANLSQMRLRELEVEWSEGSNGPAKQTLAKEVLDVLKPHSDNLKNLRIKSYEGKDFPKWVADPSFKGLTDVSIENCRNCGFLPPLGQLSSLKKLYVGSMGDVKEVGSQFLGTGPVFPSLEVLQFFDMPMWEVWSINGCGLDAVFPCLETLRIEKCPKLIQVSLEALPSLKVLNIVNCGDVLLRSVVCVASSMTKLRIADISGLSDETWGGVVQYLGAVEELDIIRCNEIRYLWESKEAEARKEVLVNLKKLFIRKCDKLVRLGRGGRGEIVEEGEGSNLPISLRKLYIYDCKNLEHLSCPANSIQELTINGCSSITCVSFPTEGEGRGWQKLKLLQIWNCNPELEKELEKQVLINDTNRPTLEAVDIGGWKGLKSITKFTCFIMITRLQISNCAGIELFPNLEDLTSLKDLAIIDCTSMDGPPPPSHGGVNWPPKLKSLFIGRLKRPISEWGPLPASLDRLSLWGGFGSSEKEEDVQKFPTSLLPLSSSSLTRLLLFDFEKMESISEGLQHLTSLQHLWIQNCPEIKDLPEKLLPSLLRLECCNINKELEEKMKCRSSSYWPLLSQIPSVCYYDY